MSKLDDLRWPSSARNIGLRLVKYKAGGEAESVQRIDTIFNLEETTTKLETVSTCQTRCLQQFVSTPKSPSVPWGYILAFGQLMLISI